MISAIVILIRIVLVYLVAFLLRVLNKMVRDGESNPGLKLPFVVGWARMRGVVSLASALAIPLTLENGHEFPHRNLILFITFVVILVTLVFQGLTLPVFLKLLKVEEVDDFLPAEKQLEKIQLTLSQRSVEYMEAHYGKEIEQVDTTRRVYEQLLRSIDAIEEKGEKQIGTSPPSEN